MVTDGGCSPENGDVHHTGYQMNHLSPLHPTSCESYSQISTIDTYLEDPSPRHAPLSHSSRSSHTHSSTSCPSTQHLKQKPLPRYGIPDHYPQYQANNAPYTSLTGNLSLGLNGVPEISVITPTPTMENQPGLGDCLSPTGTEPFSSPNTPLEDKQEYFKEGSQNRPSNLPIAAVGRGGPDSGGSTPLSDQTMIGVLLYLQHKDCDKRDTCQTCKLIDRHFERIASKYGDSALSGMMKTLTPGAEGTLKHLRKREKKTQRIRSPHRPQAPSLGIIYKRQRSHSASHVENEELTFSSTETEEDSLNPAHRRIKPIGTRRKAVTDDERDEYHLPLPLQKITEGLSLSQHDIPTTPLDYGLGGTDHHFPGQSVTVGKGSYESDSTDGSTTSRSDSNPRFDGSKASGLSVSYQNVEESLPPSLPLMKQSQNVKPPYYYSTSSGYDTDTVFFNNRTLSSESEQDSMQGSLLSNGRNPHAHTTNHSNHTRQYSEETPRDDSYSLKSTSRSHHSTGQSDYLRAATRQQGGRGRSNSNLSPSNSGALSMHSSPDPRHYRNGSQASNGSNQSNHSIHSESALQYHPQTHKHHFYSPPQRRRNHNGRTPSPIQLLLPSDDSSATPI